MKIDRVEAFHLSEDVDPPRGPSPVLYTTRDTIIVKVTTDDGLVGWGEACPINLTRDMITRAYGPMLIGEDPRDTRRLWHKLWGANFGDSFAVAGLDIALHDLRGKVLGQSVSQLYGGGFRTRVPTYAAGVNYQGGREVEEYWVSDAVRLVEEGFRAIKFRIGKYPPARELPLLRKAREAVPAEVMLMADGNAGYTLPTAIRVGHALEEIDFGWFEEPIPQADYAGYDVLADKLAIPVAAGEALQSRMAARDFIDRRKADIIQPDVFLCGGIREWLFIAELARLARIQCTPHCYQGGVALAASIHLLALMPDPTTVAGAELPMIEYERPAPSFQNDILVTPHRFADGMLDVPTGPGLGVEVNEEVMRRFAKGP